MFRLVLHAGSSGRCQATAHATAKPRGEVTNKRKAASEDLNSEILKCQLPTQYHGCVEDLSRDPSSSIPSTSGL